jgi:hypothetical protein
MQAAIQRVTGGGGGGCSVRVKLPKPEPRHSPPRSSEVKKAWSCTFSSPYTSSLRTQGQPEYVK